MLKTSPIEEKLLAAAGPQNLRAAVIGDSVCSVQPQFVAQPENEEQLASLLSCVNETGVAVIPRGGGTKLDWGNPPKRADVILSTTRLNQVLEHAWADLTVTVQAGCSVQTLQNTLAQRGQRLACDCLWPERSTVGGLLSTNDSGALRLRFGALRDLIIGVTLALSNGTLASSGGNMRGLKASWRRLRRLRSISRPRANRHDIEPTGQPSCLAACSLVLPSR